jgi:capsular polysaccharide biosynthesis protein/Mrp family chromosome partitioning ATPase
MELRDLIRVLIQRFWLLVVCAVLAMVGSYFAFRFLTPWPRYQATATVLIGGSSDFDWATLQLSRDLAPTYVEWTKRRTVLQSAIDALNLSLSFEELREQIDVRAVNNTQFIEISATSTNPEEAAVIANEIAWQLTQHPLPLVRGADSTQFSLQSDVSMLRRRIDAGEAELADLGDRLAGAESDEEVDALTRHIEVVQHNLDVWRKSYTELNTAYADYLDSFVAVVEEAIPPSQPAPPWINVFVAGLTGLVLAIGLAFVLEYLNNTVKTPADVVEYLSVPVLGVITPPSRPGLGLLRQSVRPQIAKTAGASALRAVDLTHLSSTCRRLSANIARAKKGPLQGTILVTSPTSERSKAMTALGVAMAWADIGRRTVLVDASLHHPVLHTWLGLPNEAGLINVLNKNDQDWDLSHLLQHIGRGELRVMTSGPVETVSPELLLPPWMRISLDELTDQANITLLNGPPILSGPEAVILASKVDCILLVLDARETRVEEAQEAMDVLKGTEGTIIGVALNNRTRTLRYQESNLLL